MNERQRIAIVSGGLQFGGSTTFALQLGSGFRKIDVSCAVFSFTIQNPFAEEFAAAGIPVYTSNESALIYEDRLANLYRQISTFNPTAIIANIGGEAFELLRYIPEGVARIGMIHDLAMKPQQTVRYYSEALDGVAVVNSHLVREVEMAASGVPCRFIPHGIPLPLNAIPRDPNPVDPLRLIFFGRLVEGKGTRLFPSIVSELHRRKIPFQWTIHGEGPEESFLRQRLAAEINAGEVTLSSQVHRDKLYSIIRQHDVFIMASEIEGGPLTLLEAMSAGLVPICNDIPSLALDVVAGENGFIIPKDPEKYAQCLAQLHQNRSLLERMSVAARKTITDNFTVEAMARRYSDFSLSLRPNAKNVSWPERIRPRPILGSSVTVRLAHSLGVLRSARRLLKRVR